MDAQSLLALCAAQQLAATLTTAVCARLGSAGIPVDAQLAAEKGVVFETAVIFKINWKFIMEGDHLGDTSAAAWQTGFAQITGGGSPVPAAQAAVKAALSQLPGPTKA